jgi:probable rRNA maturation factor
MAAGDQRSARPHLQVSVCDERGRPLRGSLARWLAAVAPARARGTLSVAIVGDARVRALNRHYRKKDYATDVLSFPADPTDAPAHRRQVGGPAAEPRQPDGSGGARGAHLGDIVIARGVARRQARAAGHAERTELRVLALHGLLHLLGYDHEHDDGEMARLEKRLRRKGGLREGLIERQ